MLGQKEDKEFKKICEKVRKIIPSALKVWGITQKSGQVDIWVNLLPKEEISRKQVRDIESIEKKSSGSKVKGILFTSIDREDAKRVVLRFTI